MTAVLPEPYPPWFLHRSACAYADDFALATASLREPLPNVADAFAAIGLITGMYINYQKCHLNRYGNLTIP